MGGQAVQADDLLRRFRQDGFTVGFLPVNPQLPGFFGKLQRVKYVRTLLTLPAYVLSLLRNVPKFDVLHLFSASYTSFLLAPAPAAIIGKLFGKRVVLNYHSGEAEDHLRKSSATIKRVLRYVDVLAVPSEYLRGVFGSFGIAATVIPNVVDMERFAYAGRVVFRPRFLVARMLEPLYNVGCVLRTFRLIQNRFPEAVLTILGNGSQEQALRQEAIALGLQNVHFAGLVERATIPQYYADHDIMLNASNIDNLPLSILEAFAAGLPVVSTEAGGIPHMITDRQSGMLVALNDCQSLAERALELLDNQEMAGAIAAAAYSECKKYAWAAVREQWMKVYGGA